VIRAVACPYGSVENLTLLNDLADGYVYAVNLDYASNLSFSGVTIKGFSAAILARGIFVATNTYYTPANTAVIENSLFENNGTAVMLFDGMSPTFRYNQFLNNEGSGIYMRDFCNPEIYENLFEGNGDGIYIWDDSRPLVHDNTIVRNRTGMSHAWRSHSTIVRNIISENESNGIYAVSYSSPLITNNIINNNGGDGLWLFLNWPRAENNTIIGNAGNGVTIQYNGSVQLWNNIIAFNDGWGTYAGEDYYRGYPRLYYSDLYGNGLGDASPWSQVYTGTIFDDPLFRDFDTGDYQLAAGSACIDTGNPDPIYNDKGGTRNDMGAFGGPEAMQGSEPTIAEEIAEIVANLVTLPDNAFKNEAEGRKESLEEKFAEVLTQIEAGHAETDPALQQEYYQGALKKLENDLKKKCDGYFGGHPKNDWIVTYEAQSVVYPMIVDLINEVQMLLDAVMI
jgi:parallel beta-helix repeat protein